MHQNTLPQLTGYAQATINYKFNLILHINFENNQRIIVNIE